jgi:hypothetical protein
VKRRLADLALGLVAAGIIVQLAWQGWRAS